MPAAQGTNATPATKQFVPNRLTPPTTPSGNTTATVSFKSFVSGQVTIPDDAIGKTFTVAYESVEGATRYVAQASTDQSFATVKDSGQALPPATSLSITVSDYGAYYVRVRAIDPYAGTGPWATAVSNIVVMSPPDLIVESLTHAPANPTTASTITVTAVVKNVGGASAGASTLELRGDEASGAPHTQVAVPEHESGEIRPRDPQRVLSTIDRTRGRTFNRWLALTEWSRQTGSADVANAVAESDETNNVKTDDYTVTPALADLVISGPLTLTPTTAAPGQQVSLNFNVTNQGTAASNAFRVGFYLSPDTTITAGDRLLFSFMHVSLVPGDSRNSGAAVTIPPSTAPGTYFIGPLADDQNAILESDETNNFKSTTLTVTGPDLVVSGWGVPPVTPTGVPPQGAVSLAGFTVTNQGTAASNPYNIGFYLSSDTTITSGDLLLSGYSVSAAALGAGASVTIPARTANVPPSAVPGNYFIGPLLDDQNGTAESNEANNFRSTRLSVLAPDQVNDPTSAVRFGCPVGGGSIYQSFTPTRPSLVAVQLRLVAGGSFPTAGTNTSVNIRSGSPAGAILGTSSVFVVGPQPSGRQFLVLFQFSPAAVTPGSSVVIEWLAQDPTLLGWAGSQDNPYAGGSMFGCTGTALPTTDLNFETF